MAAQDFCHAMQGDTEPVADFILRIESTFRSAYGRDSLSYETRDTLLHGQLQEGLHYKIMEAPAVSGASKYSELCLVSRNEEQRQHELTKRQRLTKLTLRVTLQETPASSMSRASAHSSSAGCYSCSVQGRHIWPVF